MTVITGTAGSLTTGSTSSTNSTSSASSTSISASKWVWRPRWWTKSHQHHRDHHQNHQHRRRCCRQRDGGTNDRGQLKWRVAPSTFALMAVALLVMLTTTVQDVRALGFFELQILEIENYRGQLATGECCGSGGSSLVQPVQQPPSSAASAGRSNMPSLQCTNAPQCNTLFQVCLREYQSRQQQQQQPVSLMAASALVASGGRVDDEQSAMGLNHHQPNSQLHHCSFGNVTSPVLGGNSFTLGGDTVASVDSPSDGSNNRGAAGGNLALPFSFSWTRSFTFILQAMDYNNYTGALSVIEEATYSGILLPGNEWKALSHLGRTARMAYRVRVRCDRNYYGQTCTKLCKPRDDRFGHYTCGDTDGRKECIPGWQGETCDKAVCKTGCHPVHGKCDYPGGCECRKGWQGELCDQCMTYPGCKHGYCNGTSWQCICDVNWGGILCDQDLNYCGTHEPCLNGGTCKSTAPDQYTCTCPEGFGGANCDVVLNPCATEPCFNGGTCRTVDAVNVAGGGVNGGGAGSTANGAPALGSAVQPPPLLVPKQFHCDCRPGWTGSTCNSEIDECAIQPPRCLNGGSCVDLVANWRCACPDDRWRGRRCEIDVDECERQHRERQSVVTEHQCGQNAVPCRTTGAGGNSVGSIECVCRRGWTTVAKESNNSTLVASTVGCTVNVDDCAGPDVKCANGGTCLDLIGGYTCLCPVGYTGKSCRTQIDPCGSDGESGANGSTNPCKNGGECVPARPRWRSGGSGSSTKQQQQQQTYSCICQWGYTGENCEIDRDHCTPNPCRNGGQCLNTPDDYYCQCSGDGWAWHGKNCTEPSEAGVTGASKTTPTTVTTTIISTTNTPTTASIRTPSTRTSPQPPSPRTSTVMPVVATRRPSTTGQGTTVWRQLEQQHDDGDDENNNKGPTVAVEEQPVVNGGLCSGRHRRKHWLADDGCNECRCSKSATSDVDDKAAAATSAMSCTNLWCGPTAYDCLSDATCTGTNQVCVPIANDIDDEELLDGDLDKREYASGGTTPAVNSLLLWRQCLRPPCGGTGSGVDVRLRYGYDDDDDEVDDDNDDDDDDDDSAYVAVKHRTRGQCVTAVADEDGTSTTVWPSAVRHCLPNDKHPSHQKHRRRRGDACGRLRVTLDPGRLRGGTRVSAVCHSLRRLLARAWARDGDQDPSLEEEEDRKNRMYVMCEAATGEDRDENDRSSGIANNSRGRRRRRVTIRVSVAVVADKQPHQRRVTTTTVATDDGDDAASVVGRAVQTLYKQLNGGASAGSAASGHRLRGASSNAGGDSYDDAAALAFLTAAVLDVTIGSGTSAESPLTTVPAGSAGSSSNDDYRQYYYYWTGGVACGALATVLAVAAFLLLRFRGGARRKIGDEQVARDAASAAADSSTAGGDGLMLSLVRRQNEENLKRLVTGGNRNSMPAAGGDYGGGCGRNNLSAGSSLSCSRVSIVHPLCNATVVDDGSSPQQQRKLHVNDTGGDGNDLDDDKAAARDKANIAVAGDKANVSVAPVAAVRSVAVALPRQQQRPTNVAAPQPLLLCKKTLNVDNDQQQRRQLQQQYQQQQQQQQQQQHQQQQQQQHQQQQQQQQQPIHYQQQIASQQVVHQQQQIAVPQQYNHRSRGDILNHHVAPHQQQYLHNQQQQRYAETLMHSITPVNNINNNINSNSNNNNADDGDESTKPPSLTVLV
ncbi:uncharacterized protein LOC112688909 [Sipha flava]|uniref:Delta-like protein n=2 Tax=Sipha flava TaxID=143950 RepID=A0A8B8G5X4_9HEMI|nr:uncharacterized protein LOC112688909 [Sipha flava]